MLSIDEMIFHDATRPPAPVVDLSSSVLSDHPVLDVPKRVAKTQSLGDADIHLGSVGLRYSPVGCVTHD